MMSELSVALLKELLYYHKSSGDFVWLNCNNSNLNGTQAGGVNSKGYIQIKVAGARYLASRLAWFYVNGVWPEIEIDHRNRDSLDNSYDNLREADRSLNSENRGLAKSNKSGTTGVFQDWRGAWFAIMKMPDGTKRRIRFKTKEEAVEKILQLRQERESMRNTLMITKA